MIFTYDAITNTGEKKAGTVEAASKDLAIAAIQRRGLIVSSMVEGDGKKAFMSITIFTKGVSQKDIVIMSRQISTLFEAQVSALKAFTLLATNTENEVLVKILEAVAEDIQAGVSISQALAKYPAVFSDFYVNMVKSGEESGKLTQIFSYLADYLDRQYQLTSKTKNALIYPAFVMGIFFLVMIMMFVFIVPRLAAIIQQSGQEVPLITKIVIGTSDLLVHYGIYMLIVAVFLVLVLIQRAHSARGKEFFDRVKISLPIFKNIYTKLYLSRVADNMDTMLSSGITIVHSIELTAAVVGNKIYEDILSKAVEEVKGGSSLSDALAKYNEIPAIMSQMIRVGEETGSLGTILKTIGKFYNREVNEAVDTLVSLIEPAMIVALGLGVGLLLASILIPIYNVAGGIS
jgi:type II secretory pathway component PulF